MPAGPDADAVEFPDVLRQGLKGGPEFQTAILTADQGYEQRNIGWASARSRWSIACRPRLLENFDTLRDFFDERRGRERAFTFHCPIEDRDVIARFDTDAMSVVMEGSKIAHWDDIPLVEVRDSTGTYPFTEPDIAGLGDPPVPPTPTLSADSAGSLPSGTYWVRVSLVDPTLDPARWGQMTPPVGPITLSGGDHSIFCDSPAFRDAGGNVWFYNIFLASDPLGPWTLSTQWASIDGTSLVNLRALFDNHTDPPEPLYRGDPDVINFPLKLTRITGGPTYRTIIHAGASGYEKRFAHWESQRRRFELEHDQLTPGQAASLLTFFRQHRGRAIPFVATDPVTGEEVLARFDSDRLELVKHHPARFGLSGGLPIIEVRN